MRFDFSAKVPAGAAKEEFQEMLRNLLAVRCKPAVHREKRAISVYQLTVGKNGPKFHQGTPKDPPEPTVRLQNLGGTTMVPHPGTGDEFGIGSRTWASAL